MWKGPDAHYALAEATIEVVEAAASIAGPAKVSVGEGFDVTWTGPGETGDYVDIVPEGYAETSGELAYAYVRDGATLALRAPGNPGRYQMRYLLEAPGGREVLATVPLQVDPATATLAFPPTAEVGSEIAVYWTGPAGQGDYIDLVPAGYSELSGEMTYDYVARSGGDEVASMTAPSMPGSYEIRYVLQAPDGRQLLASQGLEVTEASVSLDAPGEAVAGSTLKVGWTGPAGRRNYIDIVPADVTDVGGELDYFYTGTPGGGEGDLRVPEAPGSYALRFILDAPGGARVLASVPLTVQ
jgi:Ca-activated chloride channel family protein